MMKMTKNRLELLEQKKNNNRGSAFILTIVSIAMLCFMISVILTLSVYNFRMKATDLKGKKTFYTAETAMDEIRAGLQQDVSEALSTAYIKIMESSVETAVEDREGVFRTEYVNQLRYKLKDGDKTDKYGITYLEGFLKKTAYDNTKKTGAAIVTAENTNKMELTKAGLVLRNVVLKYCDEQGYVSEIQTDIVLQFPEIDFSQKDNTLDFLNYVMIANDKLDFSNGATVQAKGSTYAGKNSSVFNSATVSFLDLENYETKNVLVCNQSLVNELGTLTVTDIELWARDLVVDNGHVDINGDTYLSDDLEINNSIGAEMGATNVKIQGGYYGYGSLDSAKSATSMVGNSLNIETYPASYSSAILVNGAKSTVDLSGVTTLMIAGNAYIGASSQNSNVGEFATGTDNVDIAMGESISIKSNQTAYLVPADCIAPDSEYGGNNPIPAAKYNSLLAEVNNDKTKLVDLTAITNVLGSSTTLSQLGVTGYKTVCYPIQNLGSMVYFFMEFDSEASANSFFVNYHNKNLNRLEQNLELYAEKNLGGIKVPDDMDLTSPNSTFYYNGNIVVNEDSKASFYINKLQTASAEESTAILNKQKSYYDTFTALGKKLGKDYFNLTPEELGSDVYNNLVDSLTDADVNKNIQDDSSKAFATAGADPYGTVIVNGNYTIDSDKITAEDSEGNAVMADLRVVIASGDVTVEKDFKGMIIAGGQIIANGLAVDLEAAPTEVAVALVAEDGNGIKPVDYLKGVDAAMLGGSSTEGSADGKVDISNLIVYEDWKKQ